MSLKMLRLPQVLELTGVSRSTIYKLMANGDFPQPLKLGARVIAWPEDRIRSWLTERCGPTKEQVQ